MADRPQSTVSVGEAWKGSGPHIEVECSHCGADFDIEPCAMEAEWECPGCGRVCRVGDVGQLYIPDGKGDFAMVLQSWRLHCDAAGFVSIKEALGRG